MDEEYLYWFILIVSVIIVLIIIPRFFFYTPRGDIDNYYTEKLDEKMDTSELIEALYELCIYDYCKVRWHYTFLLSLTASIFLLYIIDSFNLQNIIIATLLFFVALELPGRLENGHIKSTTTNKATIIFGALSDRSNKMKNKSRKNIKHDKNY